MKLALPVWTALTALTAQVAAQCPDGSPPPCAAGRPGAPPPAAIAESVITVLPFRTVGPALALWREGLVDLLSMNLDGAGGLHAVSPRRVLARFNRTRAMPDPAAWSAIARDLGAATFITGSVIQTGRERVRLLIESYDARSGRKRADASFSLDGSETDLGSLADSAGVLLLSRLSRIPMPTVTRRPPTTSLEALRVFLAGEQAFRAGHYAEADMRYRESLELDSAFALPLYRRFQLRYRGQVSGPPSEAELSERALALADRLPERERLLLWAVRRGSDYVDSTDLVARLDYVRRYPEDVEGYVWTVEWYYHNGTAYGAPLEKVLEYGRRAVEIDSTIWTAYHHAIEVMARLGDSAGATALLDRYLRIVGRDDLIARAQSFAIRFRFGDSARVEQVLKALTEEPPEVLNRVIIEMLRFDPRPASLGLVERVALLRVAAERTVEAADAARSVVISLYVSQGRLVAAASVLDTILQRSPPDLEALATATLVVLSGLAPDTGAYGRSVDALRQLAQQTAATGHTNVAQLHAFTALSRFELTRGDTAAVVSRARALRRQEGTLLFQRALVLDSLLVAGYLALRRGDTSTAISLLSEGARIRQPSRQTHESVSGVERWYLALLHRARGEIREARFWLDQPERTTSLDGGFLGLRLLLAADLALEAGESERARQRYSEVIVLWKNGDAGVQPYVARAREAVERLSKPSQ